MNTFNLDDFSGKDIVFVGKGRGRSMQGVQEFLENFGSIKSFTGVDKEENDNPLGFLKNYHEQSTVFIKNEGVPGRDMPVPYITPMQIFFDAVKSTGATTIGITGTKGKSTTTSLTAAMLKQAGKEVILAGNIGNSPLAHLGLANDKTIFVLEMSSYQLSDLNVSPHISACINLYNDHADWHGSLEKYWEAKHNIMKFAGQNDYFVYNPDFEALIEWTHHANCQCIAIDTSETVDMTKSKLFGDHNRLNILVAKQIAKLMGATDDDCQQAINNFEPLPHRMEYVATKNSLTYINDAIGMTPESTLASLKAVHEKYGQIGCLLLGGQDRGYDFEELFQYISELEVPNLVLFPDTIDKMKATLPQDYRPRIFETSSMQEAVVWASKNSPSDTVVLLSTAAPSYSLWESFEHKGRQFYETVLKI